MIPAATRAEIDRACQNEKNRIPLTQRNLGIGLRIPHSDQAEVRVTIRVMSHQSVNDSARGVILIKWLGRAIRT